MGLFRRVLSERGDWDPVEVQQDVGLCLRPPPSPPARLPVPVGTVVSPRVRPVAPGVLSRAAPSPCGWEDTGPVVPESPNKVRLGWDVRRDRPGPYRPLFFRGPERPPHPLVVGLQLVQTPAGVLRRSIWTPLCLGSLLGTTVCRRSRLDWWGAGRGRAGRRVATASGRCGRAPSPLRGPTGTGVPGRVRASTAWLSPSSSRPPLPGPNLPARAGCGESERWAGSVPRGSRAPRCPWDSPEGFR